MRLWAQCIVTGGKPDLGITNVFGFAAVANALDAQRATFQTPSTTSRGMA
jgi:hypothetical protein